MKIKRKLAAAAGCILIFFLIFSSVSVSAVSTADTSDDYDAQAARRLSETVQSNEDKKWPQGPQVSAEGAVLMDADTGVVLYAKNPDEKLYPASITKLMTAILTYENLDMDDTVTFSASAVNGIDRDSSNIGIDIGESLSVEDCLRAMLISSANEVALALSEKIAGSQTKFADLMNQKAKELGCTNTSFVTPNGLQDTNHYTTAHDMALIAKAFFDIPELAAMSDIQNYTLEPTKDQPDEIQLYSSNKFLTGEKKYDGIVGSKTGFTSQARQTLVTCCKQKKNRLIAVVLKEESPSQYDDTIQLFDYGFKNFTHICAADYETEYSLAGAGFMREGEDIFGKSAAPLTISSDDYLTVPNGTKWKNLKSVLVSDSSGTDTSSKEEVMGTVSYTYSKTSVGTADIVYSKDENDGTENAATDPAGSMTTGSGFFYRLLHTGTNGTLYLNVPLLLFVIILIAAVFAAVVTFRAYYNYLKRSRRRPRSRPRRPAGEDSLHHGSAENRTAQTGKKKRPTG